MYIKNYMILYNFIFKEIYASLKKMVIFFDSTNSTQSA
jgi:hypothetical protein